MQVLPGSLVQVSGRVELGDGLYRHDNQIRASRLGTIRVEEGVVAAATAGEEPTAASVARVESSTRGAVHSLLPSIGQYVLGTVSRLNPRYAALDICVLETAGGRGVYLEEPFRGTIRSQDIWPPEDKEAPTQLYMAFRPGDLVRAKIIGVGEASAGFLLSTAVEDSLGVLFARCAASGEPLVAASWNEMICSRTGVREPRKPAKPAGQ